MLNGNSNLHMKMILQKIKYYKFCRIYDNILLPFCKAGILQQEQKFSGNFPCVSKYAQKDLEILGDMPDLPGISKGEIRRFTKNGCPLTADIQGNQGGNGSVWNLIW